MLTVKVVAKFHNNKEVLVGYTIEDVTTHQTMYVTKEQLKNAVLNGQCVITNMTLTSDGRLIGKAAPVKNEAKLNYAQQKSVRPMQQVPQAHHVAPQQPVQQSVAQPVQQSKPKSSEGLTLVEAYTNGRNVVGGLMEMKGDSNQAFAFEVGTRLNNSIKEGNFVNVPVDGDKPDMSQVKRKSFSKVKDKMIKTLSNNGVKVKVSVEKGSAKYEYKLTIEGFETVADKHKLVGGVYCLVYDAILTGKMKLKGIDGDTMTVENLTGIADVRKSVKSVVIA